MARWNHRRHSKNRIRYVWRRTGRPFLLNLSGARRVHSLLAARHAHRPQRRTKWRDTRRIHSSWDTGTLRPRLIDHLFIQKHSVDRCRNPRESRSKFALDQASSGPGTPVVEPITSELLFRHPDSRRVRKRSWSRRHGLDQLGWRNETALPRRFQATPTQRPSRRRAC